MLSYTPKDLPEEIRFSYPRAFRAPAEIQYHQICFRIQKRHHLYDYDSYWQRALADFQQYALGDGYDFLSYCG